jgi:type II secretory pathway pseudopilin PulG
MIELMVSVLLLSVVTMSAMGIMNRIQRKERESSLVAQYSLQGQQLDSQFAYDLKNATKIDGPATNAGTQFNSTATYGILRSPFSDAANSTSDAIEVFVTDPDLSQTSTFDITNVAGTCTASATITVAGNFTPTATLQEDLIIVVINNKKELFKISSGSILVTGTSPNETSTFTVAGCDATVLSDVQAAAAGTNSPQLYRVQRVTYQIGNGTTTRGLYRTVNGSTIKVADDAASMQIRYELATTDSSKAADCKTKTDSRWFDHPTNTTTECSWNDIAAIHLEIVLESATDMGAPDNFNPHDPTVVDGRVRYTVHISKVPTSYMTSS